MNEFLEGNNDFIGMKPVIQKFIELNHDMCCPQINDITLVSHLW